MVKGGNQSVMLAVPSQVLLNIIHLHDLDHEFDVYIFYNDLLTVKQKDKNVCNE